MRAYLLAGGLGTRMSEETHLTPKPMVSIGGRPIIWHIMKSLSNQGVEDFVILAGYKSEVIYDYFVSYHLRSGRVVVRTKSGVEHYSEPQEDWRVTILDTGLSTMTGGRLRQGLSEMMEDGTFLVTYGDGLSDVNLETLREVHRSSSNTMTLTAVRPTGRFGSLQLFENHVTEFSEKPLGDKRWVSGGYALAEPRIAEYLADDDCVLETDVLPLLAQKNELGAHMHHGFWKAVDTLNDKRIVEDMIARGETPWLLGSHE